MAMKRRITWRMIAIIIDEGLADIEPLQPSTICDHLRKDLPAGLTADNFACSRLKVELVDEDGKVTVVENNEDKLLGKLAKG